MEVNPHEELAVAGSGAIAIGLAALASAGSDRVWLLARSDESAERARGALNKACPRVDGGDAGRIRVTTEASDLAGASLAVEAIVEDPDAKAALLGRLAEAAPGADLATTTSSLSVGALAEASIPKHLRWIPKAMQVNYTAKATSNIRVTAEASAEDWKPGDLSVMVKAFRDDGEVVVQGTITLYVSEKPSK